METEVFYCRGNLNMIYLCAGKKPAHNFYLMEQYQAYTKPLNQNDRTKARTLLENETYAETAAYMLAHDCKLEQEIISFREVVSGGQ